MFEINIFFDGSTLSTIETLIIIVRIIMIGLMLYGVEQVRYAICSEEGSDNCWRIGWGMLIIALCVIVISFFIK